MEKWVCGELVLYVVVDEVGGSVGVGMLDVDGFWIECVVYVDMVRLIVVMCLWLIVVGWLCEE